MTTAFENAAKAVAQDAVKSAIAKLAERDGFDLEEAFAYVMGTGVQIKKEPIPLNALPWCGKVIPGKCRALAYRGGLYTQCPQDDVDGGWCKKCAKQVAENGTPNNGDVDQRLACGLMSYKIGKRSVIPYGDYMKRQKYTREEVEEAAARYGMKIDPVQFECKKRGRPTTTAPHMITPLQDLPVPGPSDSLPAELPKVELPKVPKVPKVKVPKETKVLPPVLPVLPPVLPQSDSDEEIDDEEMDTYNAPKEMRPFEKENEFDDELEEEEIKSGHTAESIENLLIGDLRKLAESCAIATKENGKAIPPKLLRIIVRKHFGV